ncbi:MAG: hypothetical protein M3483_07460 [Gemmatimonadota bacterium]|nr:hypothetical protein [Gemmatimonadota bacterium]
MNESVPIPCRNCRRPAEKLDPAGWCAECRAVVVQGAGRWAWGATLLATAPAVFLFLWLEALSQRLMVLWAALTALLLLMVFRIARRVAFDLIRNRGVPPPERADDS